MSFQVVEDAGVYFLAGQGVVEQGGADADRGCASDDELDCVGRGAYSALADDRDAVGCGYLVHFVNLEQRDRLDRGPGKATADVADDRLAGLRIDGHACHGVDNLSLIHISEPTRPTRASRMPSSA